MGDYLTYSIHVLVHAIALARADIIVCVCVCVCVGLLEFYFHMNVRDGKFLSLKCPVLFLELKSVFIITILSLVLAT